MLASFLLFLFATPASAWWWNDDRDHRGARIAGWVIGMVAGVLLITLAIWWAVRRQRQETLVGYAEYRPPPPPSGDFRPPPPQGVVGLDSPYAAQHSEDPAPPPPAYQAHNFYPPKAHGATSDGKDGKPQF